MEENIKYNKKQGIMASLGIKSQEILSVPLNELQQKLRPYRIEQCKLGGDLFFAESWKQQFKTSRHYTDKNFTFSYDYDRSIKSDVYRLTVGGDVHYYATKADKPRLKVGKNLDVEKVTVINLEKYKIEVIIRLSMMRGYVDLLVKDYYDNILFDEKCVYFNSVTIGGLKEEVKKYIDSKKERLEATIRAIEQRKRNYFLLHNIPDNALTISCFGGMDKFQKELQEQQYYLYRLNDEIVIVSKPDNAGRVVVNNKIILSINAIKYFDIIDGKTIIKYLNERVESKVVLSASAYDYLMSECPEKIYQDITIYSMILERLREDLKHNAVQYFLLWKDQLKLIKNIQSYASNLNENITSEIFIYLYQLSLKSNNINEFNLLLENDIFIHLYKILKNQISISFEELEEIQEFYFKNKSYCSSLVMNDLAIRNILYVSRLNANDIKSVVILLVLTMKSLIETMLMYRDKDNFINNNELFMIKKNLYLEFTEDIAFEKLYVMYSKYYSETFSQLYNKEELRRLLTLIDNANEVQSCLFDNSNCFTYHELYQTLVTNVDKDTYISYKSGLSDFPKGKIENDYLTLIALNIENIEMNQLFELLLKVTNIITEVKNYLSELTLFDERDRYLNGNFKKEKAIKDELQQLAAIQTGLEFEHYLFKLFNKLGYQAEITKASGDQGADLIICKDGVKTVVQAKFYSSKVGNKAVQEVVSAIAFYKADNGMVVTNNYYTSSAIELAEATNIKLVNGDELEKMIQAVAILSA